MGPVVFVCVLVILGVFRQGGLLPQERAVLASAVLVLSVVWAGASLLRPVFAGAKSTAARASVEKRVTPVTATFAALVLLAVWTLLSALWSDYPARSLWAGLVVAGGVTAFVVGARLWSGSVDGLPLLVALLAALGAVVSWASLVGFGLGWSGYVGVVEDIGHAQGPFGYANALAASVVLTLPSTLWIVSRSSASLSARSLAAGSAGLQVWALVLTHSRGAVVALVGACAFIVVLAACRGIVRIEKPALRLGSAAGLGIALVLVALVVAGVVWRSAEPYLVGPETLPVAAVGVLPERSEGSVLRPMTSDAYRLKTWLSAVDAIRARPVVGYGADTFYEAYSAYKPGAKTRFAHNVLIQHGVEVGLVGVAALVALVAAVLALAARVVMAGRLSKDPAPWVCVSVVAFLVQNLVDLVWYVPSLFLLFWLCVGGLGRASDRSEREQHHGAREGAPVWEVVPRRTR